MTFFAGPRLDKTAQLSGDEVPARLKRGAGVLIAVFWAVHYVVFLVRAELYGRLAGRGFVDATVRRFLFGLFGAALCYGIYRCLRPLRQHRFARQTAAAAALALAAACIQAVGNVVLFDSNNLDRVANFLYAAMYWFWFYFSWTTAYLALSYSITVQEQERHAAELRVQAQEAQVRALRYQINPHFLFNTLNAIAALVRDAPAKAEEMVVRLSDFFRRSLAVNPMEDVTLAEEVDLQRLYLEIERTRFSDRLRLDVALEAGSAEAKVPALLLQPLVENAVKHGVARSESPTCIRVRARCDGPVLEIVVENDARAEGGGPSGEKVGLRNVSERLRSRFGDEASLTTTAMEQGGFRNTIRIPLRR
jgi:two-component system, LytTR family, sensor kinase